MNEPTNSINPMILTVLRYALSAAGGIFVTKGAIDADTLNVLIGALLTIIPTVYGAYLAYRNSKALKAAAPYVPDAIINSTSTK